MSALAHRFPRYGTVGLLILLGMQTAIFCSLTNALPAVDWRLITAWATPACWWGYILLVDAWIFRRKGESWLTTRRPTFAALCILSVAFWCVFEGYNRLMPGWEYQNLEAHLPLRFLGYVIAFATIMPGMFLTAELIQSWGWFERVRLPQFHWNASALNVAALLGAAFVVTPPFFPDETRGYLWVFVWTGWILLLEPFNYRRGAQSLFRDWEHGEWGRTLQLAAAGAVCGLLWEFWNAWAYTKWIYIFPVMQDLKLFEMPVAGFLGFLPFALEYFVMFHFIASFFTTEDKLEL